MKTHDTEQAVRSIAAAYDNRPDALIEMLHDVQQQFGCVDDAAVQQLALAINRSRAEVHGVRSFYTDFTTTPKGRCVVKLCRAESCQAAGSETLAAEMAGTDIRVTALCPTFVKTNIVRDGRIEGAGAGFAQKVMKWSGIPADGVARQTLNALDKGQLYVLPQLDARTIWRAKRLSPSLYARGAGLLGRLMAARA